MKRASYWQGLNHQLSRRAVMRGSAIGTAGLLGAALVGCGADDDGPAPGAPAAPSAPTAAPGAPGVAEVTRGGIARAQLATTEPPNLDLHQNGTFVVHDPISPCYDQLLQFSPHEPNEIISDLAHSWEYSDDLTLVFNLNEASFHDGRSFTSEDVAVSLERIKNPPEGVVSLRQGQLSAIEQIETPDDRTAVLRLSRPSASLLGILATNWMAIYSAQDILDDAFDHKLTVNGTGPFMLERYDRGALLKIERNPNYFEEGDLPYLDGMEWNIIPDAVRAFSAFRNRDLDFMRAPAAERDTIEDQMPETVLHSAAGTSAYTTLLATWKEPWTDQRARLAAAVGVSQRGANEVIMEGRGHIGGLFTPGTTFARSPEELAAFPGFEEGNMEERRAEARRLLDAAGVEPGMRQQMIVRDTFETHGVFLADAFTQLGFDINLQVLETATFAERRIARDFETAASARGISLDDPDVVFGDHYITDAPANYYGMSVPEVDRLFEQQTVTLDQDERIEITREMERLFLEDYPPGIIAYIDTALVFWNYFQGYEAHYGNNYIGRKHQWSWLDL